jgi:hypothetical protein
MPPHPLGRDRVEPTDDGTVVLLSRRPKPWTARDETPGALVRAGTAVHWDEELFEVLRIEPREGGGFRHVLAPWDERMLVRSAVEYGAPEEAVAAPVPSELRVRSGAPPAGVAGWWDALPRPARDLSLGFLFAVLLGWFFPFRLMGEGFSFLVHELGHTAVAWLFGCTALPAIVLTIAFEQVKAAAVLIWGGIAYAAYRYRHLARWNVALAAAAILYPVIAFTKAYLTFFDLGGHLAEVLVASWAFRRALRKSGPGWERPIWAFFAFYLVARNVRLFAGVATSASDRTDYLTIAIAGQNDLVKVAATTGIPITAVSAVTAIVFVAVPLAALLSAFLGRSRTAA